MTIKPSWLGRRRAKSEILVQLRMSALGQKQTFAVAYHRYQHFALVG